MNPATATTVAETIVMGLQENDKIQNVEFMEGSTDHKAVLGIETDTGELFFAEIFPA